eukprot:Skav213592  [mRNA]  locus=C9370601:14581:17119:+ [translate_table: standard]
MAGWLGSHALNAPKCPLFQTHSEYPKQRAGEDVQPAIVLAQIGGAAGGAFWPGMGTVMEERVKKMLGGNLKYRMNKLDSCSSEAALPVALTRQG